MEQATMFFSTHQAAERLGLSARTLERYRGTGEGPVFYRFGRHARYLQADLDAWARTRGLGRGGGRRLETRATHAARRHDGTVVDGRGEPAGIGKAEGGLCGPLIECRVPAMFSAAVRGGCVGWRAPDARITSSSAIVRTMERCSVDGTTNAISCRTIDAGWVWRRLPGQRRLAPWSARGRAQPPSVAAGFARIDTFECSST